MFQMRFQGLRLGRRTQVGGAKLHDPEHFGHQRHVQRLAGGQLAGQLVVEATVAHVRLLDVVVDQGLKVLGRPQRLAVQE
jgi:hypothetical protein